MERGRRSIKIKKNVSSKHVELLDFARFLAALIVAMGHILYFTPFVSGNSELVNLFMPFHTGSTAVNYFFCLSGYVLILQLDRCDSSLRWILSRFIRLFPLLWIGLLLGLGIELFQTGRIERLYPGLALSFLGIQALFQKYLLNINQPLWSLSVEIILSPFILAIHRFKVSVVGLIFVFLGSIAVIEFINNSAVYMAIPFFVIGAISARVEIVISPKVANTIIFLLVASYPITAKYIYLMGNSSAWVIAKCLGFFFLLKLLISGRPNKFMRDIGIILGKRTFALYVVHYPLTSLLRDYFDIQSGSQLPAFILTSILVTGVFTEICFRSVDQFAVKTARRILYPVTK